jgi:hypothetical protein
VIAVCRPRQCAKSTPSCGGRSVRPFVGVGFRRTRPRPPRHRSADRGRSRRPRWPTPSARQSRVAIRAARHRAGRGVDVGRVPAPALRAVVGPLRICQCSSGPGRRTTAVTLAVADRVSKHPGRPVAPGRLYALVWENPTQVGPCGPFGRSGVARDRRNPLAIASIVRRSDGLTAARSRTRNSDIAVRTRGVPRPALIRCPRPPRPEYSWTGVSDTARCGSGSARTPP